MKFQIPAGGNRKFIGTVISLAFTLLVVWIFVMATMSNNSPAPLNPADQMRLDSLRTALGRTAPAIHHNAAPNLFYNAIPAFLVLMLMLGALWYWNKRRAKPHHDHLFTVMGEQQLAPGQTIKIIAFNDEYWVIGLTGNNMTLLSKLSKEEWTPPGNGKASPPDSAFSRLFPAIQKMRS